ncbi:hypothetical protein LCGC14_1486610 [marine sediment metagenome]|uniref:Tyr recombinase domain-containing protein n=1 Tax=marine sediment metagenome TaxID=412755 RepID=A0A0F9JTV8_9ZZZZ
MLRAELEEALDTYLSVREAEGLRETTLTNYRTLVGVLLKWLGDRELTPFTFAGFFKDYRQDHAVASQQAVYNATSIFLKGIGESDLMGTMRRPRGEIPPKAIYSPGQLQALTRALKGDRTVAGLRDSAIVSLLRYCGLRASETCNLRLDDLLGQEEAVQVTGGKSRHARRTVPLVDPCPQVLATYLSRGRPHLVKGLFSSHLFLTVKDGQPMTRNTLRLMLRRRAEQVGFPISAHRFRHTWATVHARSRTNPAMIGQLAGWSPKTLYTMLSQYAHPDISDLREAQRKAFE